MGHWAERADEMLNVQAGNGNCRQGEASVDWRMPVVEDYEGGKRDESEGEECST